MSFFDSPPPPPPAPPPPPPPAEWMGPPKGWLGGFVPLRVELLRGPDVAVLLGPMEAFPTGVRIELVVQRRVPHFGPGAGPMGPMSEDFRFGIGFADGTKWTGFQWPRDPFTRPDGPVVWFNGGGGSGDQWNQRLWLWPLPPPGPMTFAAEWPSMDAPEHTVDVDGRVFRDAADHATKLWEALSPEEEHALRQAHLQGRGGFAGSAFLVGQPEPPKKD